MSTSNGKNSGVSFEDCHHRQPVFGGHRPDVQVLHFVHQHKALLTKLVEGSVELAYVVVEVLQDLLHGCHFLLHRAMGFCQALEAAFRDAEVEGKNPANERFGLIWQGAVIRSEKGTGVSDAAGLPPQAEEAGPQRVFFCGLPGGIDLDLLRVQRRHIHELRGCLAADGRYSLYLRGKENDLPATGQDINTATPVAVYAFFAGEHLPYSSAAS
ncbi:MAG: hypothetical protein NTU41_06585 [Chloroflexi bacterium]|nr:hypothetical protein [Chloroflexota bacterium]